MSEQFKFRRAESDEKIKEVCGLTNEWFLNDRSPEEAGELLFKASKKRTEKTEVYYLEHTATNKPVCLVHVLYGQAYYKDAPRSLGPSSTPDPDSIGVKPATSLTLSFVFTSQKYRDLGLANKLITAVIGFVEKELIKEELSKSDKSKHHNFTDMVVDKEGNLDLKLATYIMAKKYFWILYSAVGTFYERFGFKPYPIEFYKVPTTILNDYQEEALNQMIKASDASFGKKLRFLDTQKPQDQELVSFILQNRELEILTELNKLTFHSELTGGRKSTSSFSSVHEALSTARLASQMEMTKLSDETNTPVPASGDRRKSSIQMQTSAKFSMKPNMGLLDSLNYLTGNAAALEKPTEETEKFNSIQGAIISNELQQKTHFILWSSVAGHFVVIGVGELQFNMFGPVSDPVGKKSDQRRRGSSFTGLNELGGYNFQDLDLLFSAAAMVAKKKHRVDNADIFVAVNDLPSTIPAPMLNDYFLNYLPKAFENVGGSDTHDDSPKVELITDAASKLHTLPMLRRFGQDSINFDIDWIHNGMWAWS